MRLSCHSNAREEFVGDLTGERPEPMGEQRPILSGSIGHAQMFLNGLQSSSYSRRRSEPIASEFLKKSQNAIRRDRATDLLVSA